MNQTITFYATFSLGGPLRGCYAIIDGETENQIRIYLKERFPKDWAGLYTPRQFEGLEDKFELRKIFEVDIS